MIVVDTNILAYFVVRGSFSKECSTLYERDPLWVAPSLRRLKIWDYRFTRMTSVCFGTVPTSHGVRNTWYHEAPCRLSASSTSGSASRAPVTVARRQASGGGAATPAPPLNDPSLELCAVPRNASSSGLP